MREKGQFVPDGVRTYFLEPCIPTGGDILSLDRGEKSFRQGGSVPLANINLLPIMTLFLGGNFLAIPVQGLGKSRVFRFLPGDINTSCHLRFRHLRPVLRFRLGVEGPGDLAEPFLFDRLCYQTLLRPSRSGVDLI